MLKHSSYTATNLCKASVWKTVNLNWMLFNHQCQHVTTRTLAVNRTCSSFGDRTFAAAAAIRVWNSLPPDMKRLLRISHTIVITVMSDERSGSCERKVRTLLT